jgi:hypothetical protein
MHLRHLVILGGLLTAATAHATIIFSTGNNPLTGSENVLFNEPGLAHGPDTAVGGITQSGSFVLFQTTTGQIETPSAGQARVSSTSANGFTNLTISTPGQTFTGIVFNLDAVSSGNSTISVAPEGATNQFALSSSGQNFLTIQAINNELMSSVTISSLVGISDISQVRLTGLTSAPAAIPEPATLSLVGVSLVGLGMLRRRIKNRS